MKKRKTSKSKPRSVQGFENYLLTQYKPDLLRLTDDYGRVVFGDMTSAEQWRERIEKTGISNPTYFGVAAWLESLLQAMVYTYDRQNYDPYIAQIKIAVYSDFFSTIHPDKFLISCTHWKSSDADWISEAVPSLLGSWFERYATIFGRESVYSILQGLQSDRDIHFDYFPLPTHIIKALEQAIQLKEPTSAAA